MKYCCFWSFHCSCNIVPAKRFDCCFYPTNVKFEDFDGCIFKLFRNKNTLTFRNILKYCCFWSFHCSCNIVPAKRFDCCFYPTNAKFDDFDGCIFKIFRKKYRNISKYFEILLFLIVSLFLQKGFIVTTYDILLFWWYFVILIIVVCFKAELYTVDSVIDSSPNHTTKYCSGRLRDPVHLVLITCFYVEI